MVVAASMSGPPYSRPFPKVVRIEPAGACNLRCVHCPTGTVSMARGIMRGDVFDRVMAGIEKNLGRVKVVVLYHGGEPLLNKGFFDMVRRVKGLGVPFVKTVTNGALLDEKAVGQVLDAGIDALEVSLDGTSAAESNRIRRGSDFVAIADHFAALLRAKRERRTNRPDLFLSTTQFLDPARWSPGLKPTPPAHLIQRFLEFQGEFSFKVTWAMEWPHMEIDHETFDVFPDPFVTEDTPYCDMVENTVTVRWNGDVVACCYDLTSQLVMGNVLQDDLETIWNAPSYLGLRGGIATRHYPGICDNCNVVKPPKYLVLKSPLGDTTLHDGKSVSQTVP